MTFLWLFVVICSSWSIHRGAGILHRVLPHQGGCWLVQASQDSGMSWGILANFNAISLHSVHSMLLFMENWPKIPWSIGTIIRPCIHIYEYIHMHVPTKLFGIRFLSILKFLLNTPLILLEPLLVISIIGSDFPSMFCSSRALRLVLILMLEFDGLLFCSPNRCSKPWENGP